MVKTIFPKYFGVTKKEDLPRGAEVYVEPLEKLLSSLGGPGMAKDALENMPAWGVRLSCRVRLSEVAEFIPPAPNGGLTATADESLRKRFPGWPTPLLAYADAAMRKLGYTTAKSLGDLLSTAYKLDPSDHDESRATLLLIYFGQQDAMMLRKKLDKTPGASIGMAGVLERVEHVNSGMLNLDSDPVAAKAAIAQVLKEMK